MEPFISGPYPGRVQICRMTLRDFATPVSLPANAGPTITDDQVVISCHYMDYNLGTITLVKCGRKGGYIRDLGA